MFDFSHLPSNATVSEYVFKINAYVLNTTVRPHVWHKPPNAKLVFMFCIGGGGGGAAGQSGSGYQYGGGGGGSGNISQALFPAHVIPNSLFIYPHSFSSSVSGAGGDGWGSSGSPGINISVAISAMGAGTGNPGLNNHFVEATGGGGGAFDGAGSGGTGGNAALINHAFYVIRQNGRAGTWGNGVSGPAADTSIGNAVPILGGGGGGTVYTGPINRAGAGFTSEIPLVVPSISGGAAGSSDNASSGIKLPFLTTGGCGGGGVNSGAGGRGGNAGGYGAGGGGGGGGGSTGGRGGDGGPGYACIIAW